MFEALVIAWAVGVGVDWRVLAILAAALLFPVWSLGALAVHVVMRRTRVSTRSATFCHGVARELRAGATLRSALSGSAQTVGSPRLAAETLSHSFDVIVPSLRREFPEVADELSSLVEVVAASGASSAEIFAELGDLALAQVEVAEEVRVATAPARASSLVLLGLPGIYLVWKIGDGSAADLVASPAQSGLALVGALLVFLGIGVSYWLARSVL